MSSDKKEGMAVLKWKGAPQSKRKDPPNEPTVVQSPWNNRNPVTDPATTQSFQLGQLNQALPSQAQQGQSAPSQIEEESSKTRSGNIRSGRKRRRSSSGQADDDDDDDPRSPENTYDDQKSRQRWMRVPPDVEFEKAKERARAVGAKHARLMITANEITQEMQAPVHSVAVTLKVEPSIRDALRPVAHITLRNPDDFVKDGAIGADHFWGNRGAGEVMQKLRERVDDMNDGLDRIRQRWIKADVEVRGELARMKTIVGGNLREVRKQNVLDEVGRQRLFSDALAAFMKPDHSDTGFKKQLTALAEYAMDIRFRSMYQLGRNRGFIQDWDTGAWGSLDMTRRRQLLLTAMVHGGELRFDTAIALSDHCYSRHGEDRGRFFRAMHEKVYGLPLDMAQWLVEVARNSPEADSWIRLIDIWVFVSDEELRQYIDKNDSGLDRSQEAVKKQIAVEKLYDKFIDALRILWANTVEAGNLTHPTRPLKRDEVNIVNAASEQLYSEAKKFTHWEKHSNVDPFAPALKYQKKYDHPSFFHRFRAG